MFRKITTSFLLIISAALLSNTAYTQKVWNLEQCVVYALENNIAKLADFGLSIILENVNGKRYKYFPNKTMTVDHRSIEALEGNRFYTTADDVWSLGITFLETLSGGKSLFGDFKSEEFTDKNIKSPDDFFKYLKTTDGWEEYEQLKNFNSNAGYRVDC
jgi:serine/threonine protein kinase